MRNKLIFTTLFNSYYLSKGIAMIESLLQHCDNFHLYVFAFDENTLEYLQKRNYLNVTILSLNLLEQHFPQLLDIKPSRSFAEYCWTTTAFTIKYCLENFDIDHCTYIDADLYFFSNPSVLVEEMGDNDILITEHRYVSQYDQSRTAGKYCVQFLTARNNVNGRKVIDWWKDACYTWCYNRYEDGKFGDQKYLDDWTTRFEKVHVLKNLGGGLAPWNVSQYDLSQITPVFYHFHYFRYSKICGLYEYIFGPYYLQDQAIQLFYEPYNHAISQIHKQLLQDGIKDEELGYKSIEESLWRKPFHILRSLRNKNKRIKWY
jgi:hypothetical protein